MTATQGGSFDEDVDALARAIERRIAEQTAALDDLSVRDDQRYEIATVGLQTNAI